jgi:hypothetical protein
MKGGGRKLQCVVSWASISSRKHNYHHGSNWYQTRESYCSSIVETRWTGIRWTTLWSSFTKVVSSIYGASSALFTTTEASAKDTDRRSSSVCSLFLHVSPPIKHSDAQASPMDYLIPKGVFNIEESLLSLFRDQTKSTISYVNTWNEISGCLPNKSFATIILIIYTEDSHRVGPLPLFKRQS